MHDSYRIMSENDVQRQGGMSDAFVTVGSCFVARKFSHLLINKQRQMLAQFAATVRRQQGGQVPGEHSRIVLDENCSVSYSSPSLKSIGKDCIDELA